ncbi:14752_t:CDS:1, partial [Dentiscutata erythropus]
SVTALAYVCIYSSDAIFDVDEDINIVHVMLDGKGVSPKDAG